MKIDNIARYAIILIYSDGTIEGMPINNREFHMEYFLDLLDKSDLFKEFIKRKNIYIPPDDSAKYMLTYEIDNKLAEDGVIVIHNLALDEEIRDEIDDYVKDYYITMPRELSFKQKEIMRSIIKNYDMTTSFFAALSSNNFADVDYDGVQEMIDIKTQKTIK